MTNTIHPAARMGDVALQVADLDKQVKFYTERIGLNVLDQTGDQATLGAAGTPLLRLKARPGARKVGGTTGLYHFAILTPSRFHLAQVLRHLIETRTPIGGASDHLVSEALYLDDAEGNGIEIYRDRPRDEWPRQNGSLQMSTDPFDAEGVLGELVGHQDEPWTGMAPGTTMGHVHLHVASIPAAKKFYVDTLGFDLMFNLGSALFVSAGGYHHHLGLNTWAGIGAPPAPEEATGLTYYTVIMPNDDARHEVTDRAAAAGITVEAHERGPLLRDPSQNALVLTVG